MAAAINSVHNTQAADKLQLDLAAGSHESAAAQLHLLAPFVLSVLKVSNSDSLLHASLDTNSAMSAACQAANKDSASRTLLAGETGFAWAKQLCLVYYSGVCCTPRLLVYPTA